MAGRCRGEDRRVSSRAQQRSRINIMPFARLAHKAQQEDIESEGQGDHIYLFIYFLPVLGYGY